MYISYDIYIKKNIDYLILSKILISEISTLNNYHFQLRHFLNGFVIFHTPPHVGGVWKITKPFKKWLSWPSKTIKVTCIFFQNFRFKILKASETSKNHSGGPKNPESIQKLSIFHFPNWGYHRKTCFSAPKGAISAKSTKMDKGVYGSTVKNLTLTFGSKFFSWFPYKYWDSQKNLGEKPNLKSFRVAS